MEVHQEKMKKYACPMHSEVASDTAGKCDKCGMELIEIVQGAEHSNHKHHIGHHEMMAQDFKKRFLISLLVTIPVLLLSPTTQGWLNISFEFFGQSFVLFGLASIIALWGAFPFYRSSFQDELKERRLGMMTLVSIAVGMGYLYSAATTFLIEAPDFYWEISTLTVVLLLGHWMEMRAVIGASGALGELIKLIPPTAHLKKNGEIVDIETEKLQVGSVIVIRPGEKVPIDGVVVEGSSSVNEALITGESKPVFKEKSAEVIGGSLNIDGSLTVRVTKTGEKTALSQIIDLVRQAQESKPKTQKLADRAAHYLTLIAIFAGAGTLIFWTFGTGESFVFALTMSMTVIIITCPHALGLAIPTVTTIATTLSAKNGMLVKDMNAVELARKVNVVVFDKTGTLTKGEFAVSDIVSIEDAWDAKRILALARGIEEHSEHVIAKGIVKESARRGVQAESIIEYRVVAGKGGTGMWQGKKVFLGNEALIVGMAENLGKAKEKIKDLVLEGKTLSYLVVKERVVGVIALVDEIRKEAYEAVEWFAENDIKVAMMTGDNEVVARYVAKELGIDTYFAEVLPEDKSKKIAELQEDGSIVMMVGDGINDAPALTRADVAIAIGAGTDVAIESAQIVLVRNNPLDVVKLIKLSKKTMRKMFENLAWATGYNVVAIPVAAGLLFPFGIILRPEWGALAMSASSIIVVLNALLLKREKL